MSCQEIVIYYVLKEKTTIRNDIFHAGTNRENISGSFIYSDFSHNLSPSGNTVISVKVKSGRVY